MAANCHLQFRLEYGRRRTDVTLLAYALSRLSAARIRRSSVGPNQVVDNFPTRRVTTNQADCRTVPAVIALASKESAQRDQELTTSVDFPAVLLTSTGLDYAKPTQLETSGPQEHESDADHAGLNQGFQMRQRYNGNPPRSGRLNRRDQVPELHLVDEPDT